MSRFLALLIGVCILAAEWPASAESCDPSQPYDPNRIFTNYSREQVVGLPEVIVEGVIESYTSSDAVSDVRGPTTATMRIDKVWKGDVTPRATLVVPFGFNSFVRQTTTKSPACWVQSLIGKRIRFGTQIVGKSTGDVLGFPGGWEAVPLPLSDPKLDRLLEAYRVKTEDLRRAAASGGRHARVAYAEHLRANNEVHRAFEIYDALLREDPNDLDLLLVVAVARADAGDYDEPEKTLTEIEQRTPENDNWRAKIARARFTTTGQLTTGETNWMGVKRLHRGCYSENAVFDGATFDRSDLSTCAFRYSSFRNASFRGTNLTGSYFQNSDLTGARYDCATKLPEDLDPKAAGMINVEGQCATP